MIVIEKLLSCGLVSTKAAEHLLLSALFGYFFGKQKVTIENL